MPKRANIVSGLWQNTQRSGHAEKKMLSRVPGPQGLEFVGAGIERCLLARERQQGHIAAGPGLLPRGVRRPRGRGLSCRGTFG